MLKAGTARAVMNAPLTLAHGGWGAQTHMTPDEIDSDFWITALVLKQDEVLTVILDLDLSSLINDRADLLRGMVAKELDVGTYQIRVSTTHTHSGPVLSDRGDERTEMYFRYVIEQAVGTVLQAKKGLESVTVHAEYGQCHIGKNRRQALQDGSIITGVDPEGETDPTVTTIRLDRIDGTPLAHIVHYACHPTILGFTNRKASPDYPGVVKRFVEQTLGGTCLFLQAAAGDIGPGPGGFLNRTDVVIEHGISLGCAAVQALIEAGNKRYHYRFSHVVPSGAELGIWEREFVSQGEIPYQVVSRPITLPLRKLLPPEHWEQIRNRCLEQLNKLRDEDGSTEEITKYTFQSKRANMAWRLSRNFYEQQEAQVEVQIIRLGEIVLISVPLEPFSSIGQYIRAHSPFPYTLFSGYSNGMFGYLPSTAEYDRGGYEVEFSAFSAEAAHRLQVQVVAWLNEMKS